MTNDLRPIEILGLPGAGKSTLVRHLAERGLPTTSRWTGPTRIAGIPTGVRLILQGPAFFTCASLAVATRKSASHVHLRRVLSVQRRHLMVRGRNGSGAWILDEGPLHALFITIYGTQATRVSRPLLRLVVRLLARHISYYVFLDVEKNTCIENFQRPGRTSYRFNESSSAVTVAEFRDDDTYTEIVDALSRTTDKLRVVRSVDEAGADIELLAIDALGPSRGQRLRTPT